MKHTILVIFLILQVITTNISSQTKSRELFRIDDTSVSVSEFKRVYEKNLGLVVDDDSKKIDNYLDLYINYKLKVKEAYDLNLDTLKSYRIELENYKNQLIAPYLQDNSTIKRLVEEAYFRTVNEIKVSHLLIKVSEKGIPEDTIKAYNKALNARNRVLKGETFEEVALDVSEDPSVKVNKGNLGYFTAFKMVYNFEKNAYNTKVGEVSQPFRTKFGYHIVKVDNLRKSRGEFEVAHILIRDQSSFGKVRIDSIYQKLKKGLQFHNLAKQYSEDTGTKNIGGKLPRFGSGVMVEEFENEVYNIKKINGISSPFKTRFGWHIVKLLKKIPVPDFESIKKKIELRVKRGERSKLSGEVMMKKLKNKYHVQINDTFYNDLKVSSIPDVLSFEKNKTILTINKSKVKLDKFQDFLKLRNGHNLKLLFQRFIDEELIEYFKKDLINIEPEVRNTYSEYKEGLLLFELMQKKIWEKSSKDSIGLKKFYFSKLATYKSQSLEEIKGKVISDYQKTLEEKWISELRKKSKIIIRDKELKKLKKTYNQS
ncbi:peptidylprolyl isomerase [Tenacibaculum sp. C7A-26P2]|uniref:peptidylprolyl isomerase n=1 Tax=Tenacibaculum sp. C7A-26P2 TaxID=3447504 RepID=UPI003F84133D